MEQQGDLVQINEIRAFRLALAAAGVMDGVIAAMMYRFQTAGAVQLPFGKRMQAVAIVTRVYTALGWVSDAPSVELVLRALLGEGDAENAIAAYRIIKLGKSAA